jgi:alkylation response protein AidB-like acyl-CoA dehydrogenase
VDDYAGARGLNFFDTDEPLRRVLSGLIPESGRQAAFERLSALGQDCGGRLGSLIEAAHADDRRPRLERYDRWGKRTDRLVYCAEQVEARRLAMSHACLPPTPLAERMAKAYLLNQNGEGGVACPLAMTDGLVQLLESSGTADQKKRWLPLLLDASSDTPFTAGQFVTERQGGSAVSENETRAEPAADGSWRLTGLKWFCSNPGELWVTTAKPAGSNTVALFLVPRRLHDGSLNEARLLRLKDLSGTWGKATAEVEYAGARAELIGRPSHGMALLLRVLGTSRLHVAAGSLGYLRRGLVEAGLYARSRRVLGRPLAELPQAASVLKGLESSWTRCLLAYFEGVRALAAGDPAAAALLPLLKIQVSRAATDGLREARLLLAGNGILRDFSVLPRLAEDALIQEIWEGTHPILAGHALRGLLRPASRASFLKLCGKTPQAKELAAFLDSLGPSDAEDRAVDGLRACGLAWDALGAALKLS